MTFSCLPRVKYAVIAVCLSIGILAPMAQPTEAKVCAVAPARPTLQFPVNGNTVHSRKVDLRWGVSDCASLYSVIVLKGATDGRPVDAAYDLHNLGYTTHRLEAGQTYWWYVEACNRNGCITSRWGKFTIAL